MISQYFPLGSVRKKMLLYKAINGGAPSDDATKPRPCVMTSMEQERSPLLKYYSPSTPLLKSLFERQVLEQEEIQLMIQLTRKTIDDTINT